MAKTRRSKSKSKSNSKSRKSGLVSLRRFRYSKSGKTPSIPRMMKNAQDVERVSRSLKMNNQRRQDNDFFVGVTATWCGACHNISDRLNKALKHAKRPGSRIDETLVEKFNKSMNSSIKPPHFPYFIVIDTNGGIKQTLSSIEEVEQFLAERDATRTPSPKTAKTANQIMNENEAEEEEAEAEAEAVEESMLGANEEEEPEETTMVMESVKNLPPVVGKVNSAANNSASFKSGSAKANTALPPNATELDTITQSNVRRPVNSMDGGSLYASLATTAYQLAAPAVLLGIAAATLKKKGRKSKKTQRNRRR